MTAGAESAAAATSRAGHWDSELDTAIRALKDGDHAAAMRRARAVVDVAKTQRSGLHRTRLIVSQTRLLREVLGAYAKAAGVADPAPLVRLRDAAADEAAIVEACGANALEADVLPRRAFEDNALRRARELRASDPVAALPNYIRACATVPLNETPSEVEIIENYRGFDIYQAHGRYIAIRNHRGEDDTTARSVGMLRTLLRPLKQLALYARPWFRRFYMRNLELRIANFKDRVVALKNYALDHGVYSLPVIGPPVRWVYRKLKTSWSLVGDLLLGRITIRKAMTKIKIRFSSIAAESVFDVMLLIDAERDADI